MNVFGICVSLCLCIVIGIIDRGFLVDVAYGCRYRFCRITLNFVLVAFYRFVCLSQQIDKRIDITTQFNFRQNKSTLVKNVLIIALIFLQDLLFYYFEIGRRKGLIHQTIWENL